MPTKTLEPTQTNHIFNFPLFRSRVTRRVDLGNGNWVEYAAVKTGGMQEEFINIISDASEITVKGGQTVARPRGGVVDIATLQVRLTNWHLEFEGETLPFSKANVRELSQPLIEHLVKEIAESDEKYLSKETGMDDPNG